MQPEERDAAYLWDMLDAARTIAGFIKGYVFLQYENDRKVQLAVERSLEIIGEAARRVSDNCKNAHPEIPWKNIVAQRNVLAHEYGEIKQERIWLVVSERIPELIRALELLV
jgi:uncharacterized protein with HEPN domain